MTQLENTQTKLEEFNSGLGLFDSGQLSAQGDEIEIISSRVINFYLVFTASIFFIYIIYAGIMWMTARGNEEQAKKAQKLIFNSTIAFALIFFSYLIAFVISAFLTQNTKFQKE